MHGFIQAILFSYLLEGIKASDVAILISKEGGAEVLRCMAPQQHNGARAVGIKQRLEHRFREGHTAEVCVQPSTVYAEGKSQVMHTVVVHVGAVHRFPNDL